MTSLMPKLVVTGADDAIAFYTDVFGAQVRQRYTAGETVVYALLELFGGRVSLKEADEYDPSPTTLGRPGVLLDVTTDDPEGLAKAVVDAGGTVVFPVDDQPYGARGGRVRDPYGHEWLLQTEITLSDAEVQQRMDALA
jgi:PhnB protein